MLRSTRLLIAARALAGMTQSDLASAAGIALSVLQAAEQGKSDPKLSTVLALLDTLKAQGVELLVESETMAWGVFVVPGSTAEIEGRTQPSASQALQRSAQSRLSATKPTTGRRKASDPDTKAGAKR